jgi:hypothetical protein
MSCPRPVCHSQLQAHARDCAQDRIERDLQIPNVDRLVCTTVAARLRGGLREEPIRDCPRQLALQGDSTCSRIGRSSNQLSRRSNFTPRQPRRVGVWVLSCETVLLRRRPSIADPWCAFSQVLRLLAPCPVETPTPLGMTHVPRCDQTGNPVCKAWANRPAGTKRQIE